MDAETAHATEYSWPRAAIIFLATLCGVVITWLSHRRFWFAHDEGTLAQAALHVVEGLVPHRDFSHPYTGADALLHALWFQLLGASLGSIRTGFAILVSLWLVGMGLWIWSRTRSMWASVGLLVMGVFGPAMYPAAIPSWYVTIFVCGAIATLSPGAPFPSRRAFLVAGVLLGLAAGFKVTALYALGGVVLWVVGQGNPAESPRARIWAILVVCAAALGVVGVMTLGAGARQWAFVGAPALVAVLWAGLREVRAALDGGVKLGLDSTGPLVALCLGFALGFAPIVIWLGTTGGLAPFLESLTGVGAARTAFASYFPPRLHVFWKALPIVLIVVASYRSRVPHTVTILLALVLVFVLTWTDARWHQGFWHALRSTFPIGIALVAGLGLRRSGQAWMPMGLVVLALMSLSQFPFASPIYFVYLIPIAVVGALMLPSPPLRGQRLLGVVGLGAAFIGATQVVPAAPNAIGIARVEPPLLESLPGSRGGLLIAPEEAAIFGQLHRLLRDSIPAGAIWAGPDSPEVAFLSSRPDVNRDPFSFLSKADRIDDAMFLPEVVAVIVRTRPPFSPAVGGLTLRQIEARFRRRAVVGPFLVFWGRGA